MTHRSLISVAMSKYRIIIIILLLVVSLTYLFDLNFTNVVGTSMYPTLNSTDLIITTKKIDKLSKGDIVVFEKNNTKTIHRINNIIESSNQTLYQTKGDKNIKSDIGLIRQSDIQSRMLFKVPLIGTPIFLLFIIIGYMIYDNFIEKKKEILID